MNEHNEKIEDQKEINLNPVTPFEYLQKHKINGIGDVTINKFLSKFNLKNTSMLNMFINSEYKETLKKTGLFPESTTDKLIVMLDNIKNR